MQEEMDHLSYLKLAVDEAFKGIRAGAGGPFGALVVLDGQVIGKGHNTVLQSKDPTAHAEVNAIRDACRHMENPHLSGAVIYSNFEPCPMCLSAIYWADIRMLYYANDRSDAERMGFMDKHLYHELRLGEDARELQTVRIAVPEMEALMKEWKGLEDKLRY
jgi:tRNA(Arg) A34 adenosine deaminase TadA